MLPLVYTCFHFLFDDDGVVSRGSFNALSTLVTIASTQSDSPHGEKWRKLLEGSIVPLIKTGLSSHVEFARRFYILLLKEVVQQNKGKATSTLFSDLNCLIYDDEPDLDFFLNITHVQLHRRARALQRLRKMLVVDSDGPVSVSFSLQSLSSILLPLATHPIYESKTKLDEKFALEGIATVGAISRHLSWSKYNALLWNHLTQFERHPELEKYLVGLICAIIDGFHFEIENQGEINNDTRESLLPNDNAIWRGLENRIIPKVESMMVKEKTDKKGVMLRPSILLALHKLIHKLPTNLFQAKLPRLLAVVCDALRNRESDARDIARVSLAKMVVEMDMAYLSDVLRELATSLTEGYKLHVRNATIHTILLEIAKVYTPPKACESNTLPTFDKTVPAFMDLIQQDIFGEAQERKDAQGSKVRFVKEAGGAKTAHSLELIASMILFRPSMQLLSSSVHVIVTPLLERLRTPGVSTTVTRRIKECLSRIVTGLLQNPSIQCDLVMQFVFATLEPFVSKFEIESVMELMDDDLSSDEDDPIKPIQVSGKRKSVEDGTVVHTRGHVVEWRPSSLKTVTTTKAARRAKEIEEKEAYKVQDGASAPKLTGSSRMAAVSTGGKNTVNDSATVTAVIFGLQLLSPTLKKLNDNDNVHNALLDRFVPLLTTCVCRCRNTDVVLLALRCLGWLLNNDLPSLSRCSKSLATKVLELITSAGSNQELLQATFKMLTFLISFDRRTSENSVVSVNNVLASKTLPLDDEQLQVLLSFLRESVVSTDQHNPAIALIKAIMSRRYLSVEFYDLMETLLEQSVRSSKPTLRDQSGVVFLHYLINYPLSTDKIEKHLKQVVLNLSYQYAEGRMSAIGLASMIIDKLPGPVIEQHCQLFFFPLTLQLVNDDSKDCRELVAKCLGKLIRNVSVEVVQSLFEYIKRWAGGDISLQRMSLRLLTILVDIRPDYVKRNEAAKTVIEISRSLMEEHAQDWEILYFTLLLVESTTKNFNHHVIQSVQLWECVIQSMVHDHVWVKKASVRLLSNHIATLNPNNISSAQTFLKAKKSGLLFQMARNLCYQLGVDETQQNDEMTTMVVKVLTWTIQAATKYPELCYPQDGKDVIEDGHVETDEGSMDDDTDDNNASNKANNSTPNPVQWIITRLSNLARLKGTKRRQSIFKCFAAFITLIPSREILYPHLEKMIEPLYRVEVETKNDSGNGGATTNYLMLLSNRSTDEMSEEGQVAKDVMQLLESHCESNEMFLQAYMNVQNRFKARKEQRKSEIQIQVVTNPSFAAQRRVDKQIREKHRRQRRVQERRTQRGGGSAKAKQT
jgi:U3 small nucleolar RNA-associated protein 20